MKKNFFEFRPYINYEDALRYQSFLYTEGYAGIFSFVSHPVITLGLSSNPKKEILVSFETLKKENIEVLKTDRGGKATYHGPGQLVVFPIINLKKGYKNSRAVKLFFNELLLGIAHACISMGVQGIEIRPDKSGIWTKQGKKLASVGIVVKKGYVFHGFSLNVTNESLPNFSKIRACGLIGSCYTSLEAEGVKRDKLSNMEDLVVFMSSYLEKLFPERSESKGEILSFNRQHKELADKIDKSDAALDYFLLT